MKRSTPDPSPIRLGVSACLLGERVRYDGSHKLDRYLHDVLGTYVEWVSVCPEVECGLPVPREAMRLVGTLERQRLVTIRTKTDHTQRIQRWISSRLDSLSRDGLYGFVLKSRSPSCGLSDAEIYSARGAVIAHGLGMFAREVVRRFPDIPVEDEGQLHDESGRENFAERIFTFARWRDFRARDSSLRGLVDWHTEHKLLLMSHSPVHARKLGGLVASAKAAGVRRIREQYFSAMSQALHLPATVKKHVNVLQHAAGYFKGHLTADQKQELGELIEAYRHEQVPLIVPITLINHYVRAFREPYLERQVYLRPHPVELKLRNHA